MERRRIWLTAVAAVATVASTAGPASAQSLPTPPAPPTGPCGGALQPPCPPPPEPEPQPQPQPQPQPPSAVSGTLKASKADLTIPAKVVLTVTFPDAPAGTEVRLDRTVPGYGSQPPVEARLGAGGVGRWTVEPRLNTTYRAIIADGQRVTGASNTVDVRAYPRYSIKMRAGRRSLRAELQASLGLWNGPAIAGIAQPKSGDARYAFFYANPKGSRLFYRVGRGRLRVGRCGVFGCVRKGSTRLAYSRRVTSSKYIFACTKGLAWVGGGLPFDGCGRRVLR